MGYDCLPAELRFLNIDDFLIEQVIEKIVKRASSKQMGMCDVKERVRIFEKGPGGGVRVLWIAIDEMVCFPPVFPSESGYDAFLLQVPISNSSSAFRCFA